MSPLLLWLFSGSHRIIMHSFPCFAVPTGKYVTVPCRQALPCPVNVISVPVLGFSYPNPHIWKFQSKLRTGWGWRLLSDLLVLEMGECFVQGLRGQWGSCCMGAAGARTPEQEEWVPLTLRAILRLWYHVASVECQLLGTWWNLGSGHVSSSTMVKKASDLYK